MSSGRAEPKQPKADPVSWFFRGPGHADDHEVLFYAFLIARTPILAKDQHEWANEVVRFEMKRAEDLKEHWRPTERWGKKNGVSKIFDVIESAFRCTAWPADVLDEIGAQMSLWHGPGRFDNLKKCQLADYLKTNPPGVSANPKKPNGTPRWRTWRVVHVAELLLKHGPKLRRPLELEAAALMPSYIREAVLTKSLAEADERLGHLGKLLKKAADANRKQKERAQEKREEKKKRESAKAKALTAARKKAVATAVAAATECTRKRTVALLDAKYKADVDKREKEVQTARARARAVENDAKRCRKAEKKLKEAKQMVKELEERLMDVEEESESDEDEPEQKKRRDARGRFTGLPWEQRPLIYGQLGRRVPPTAISANIIDVLTVYATEKVVPMPCVQEIRRMRGELTVAGEALAAFRVALARRIISFGFDESTKFGMGLLSSNTQIEPHDAPGTSVDVVQRGASAGHALHRAGPPRRS